MNHAPNTRPGLTWVKPAEPAAAWIGGKRLLAKRLCGLIAATLHDCYCEPFVGMGGIFLRRSMRPAVEVINDVSGDLVNLYRILQRHPEALFTALRWRPAMRSEFDRLKTLRGLDLTDIERAATFLYLQTLAFAGKVKGRNFGIDPASGVTFNLARLRPRLEAIHERLTDVVIEHLDWSDLIPRYDRAATLFYLDPPYWGSEDDYGTGLFPPSDFARLAETLKGISGKFIVSINDVPEIRSLFDWADITPVETRYTIGKADPGAPVQELLISKGVNLNPIRAAPRLL
jgi:DNA adenine methylase